MTTALRLTLCAAALALSACTWPTQQGQQPATATTIQPTCDPQAAQWAVGKPNTERNIRQAQQEAGATMVRVLNEGQPTTREFHPGRLNLEVNARGTIVAARCG